MRLLKPRRLWRDESGATAVEYGLILSLVVLALVAALANVGNEVNSDFDTIADQYSEANN